MIIFNVIILLDSVVNENLISGVGNDWLVSGVFLIVFMVVKMLFE